MIVVDTNHLDVLMGKGPRTDRLVARLVRFPEHEVVTTIVNLQEKVQGWLAEIRKRDRDVTLQVPYYARLGELMEFFRQWDVLAFDTAAAARFERLRKLKLGVKPMDLKIACISLEHDALLLTANLGDFRRVPGLKVEDWQAG